LIELCRHIMKRCGIGRHRQEFNASLILLLAALESRQTPADAEQLDVTPAFDLDRENADRTDRQAHARLNAAPGAAHFVDLCALTPHENCSAGHVGTRVGGLQ
jgi:hypothetical protein